MLLIAALFSLSIVVFLQNISSISPEHCVNAKNIPFPKILHCCNATIMNHQLPPQAATSKVITSLNRPLLLVGSNKGVGVFEMAVAIVPDCQLTEGVNWMALQLAPQWWYHPRGYRMAQEGVPSHSVPFVGVMISGFLWRQYNRTGKCHVYDWQHCNFFLSYKIHLRSHQYTKTMLRTWTFILST